MPAEPMLFPPRPLRDVQARHLRQAGGCGGGAAIVTVDFEPCTGPTRFELTLPDDVRFRFGPAGGDEDYREVFSLLEALDEGLREVLAEDGRITVHCRAVLRSMVVHPVDSHPRAFREAGRLAARKALEQVFGTS
ncbi:hypothetical protein ABT263_34100 [Kitasatospora sp. NPDC001603]|uniref:hypothetical protein n=1 Tax=Kitasatospora sp. NPDC001603 TaxID=3154388 RepID=UPI00331A97D9